jgi:hypothetical protein
MRETAEPIVTTPLSSVSDAYGCVRYHKANARSAEAWLGNFRLHGSALPLGISYGTALPTPATLWQTLSVRESTSPRGMRQG